MSFNRAIEAMRCVEINFCSDCRPCSACGEFGLSDAECRKLVEAALPHLELDAQRRIDKAQQQVDYLLALFSTRTSPVSSTLRVRNELSSLRQILAGETE